MRQVALKFLIAIAAVGVVIILLLHGCAINQGFSTLSDIVDPDPLEFKTVFQYKMDINPTSNLPERISGLCGRSSYCVKSVMTKVEGHDLRVLVHIGMCDKGETGDFSIPLNITKDIDEVKFGNEGYILWTRQQSSPSANP